MKRIIAAIIICVCVGTLVALSLPGASYAEKSNNSSTVAKPNFILDDTTGQGHPLPPPPAPL